MATFRKRNGKWQAQVRLRGANPVSRSFLKKRDAEAWARQAEAAAICHDPVEEPETTASVTLGDLLERYRREVTSGKRGGVPESYRLAKMALHPLARLPASAVKPADIAAFRDQRLRAVSADAVRKELSLIRQVFDLARREWGLLRSGNPADDVRRPVPCPARTRRISDAELMAIGAALRTTRNPVVAPVIGFALATAMRRGEILWVEWRHLNWGDRTLPIPLTKTGRPRTIPLSGHALRLLAAIREHPFDSVRVFPITPTAFRLSWERVCLRAGVRDLRFHDFRHEAVSRFFETGLSLPEVALISGHRDPRQLLRYTHLDAARVAQKLAGGADPGSAAVSDPTAGQSGLCLGASGDHAAGATRVAAYGPARRAAGPPAEDKVRNGRVEGRGAWPSLTRRRPTANQTAALLTPRTVEGCDA